MRRRGFLKLSGAALTGMVLDPELALWVPGRKRYVFLAPPRIRMVSIAELVAATYEQVMAERSKPGQTFWGDEEMIRYLVESEHAILARRG